MILIFVRFACLILLIKLIIPFLYNSTPIKLYSGNFVANSNNCSALPKPISNIIFAFLLNILSKIFLDKNFICSKSIQYL